MSIGVRFGHRSARAGQCRPRMPSRLRGRVVALAHVVGTVHSHFFWHMHFIFSHVHWSSCVCAARNARCRCVPTARLAAILPSHHHRQPRVCAYLSIGGDAFAGLQEIGVFVVGVALLLRPLRLHLAHRHAPPLSCVAGSGAMERVQGDAGHMRVCATCTRPALGQEGGH